MPNVVCHKSGALPHQLGHLPQLLSERRGGGDPGPRPAGLALFGQIAKSLNITARYAGEEPSSQVTGLYNQVMARSCPRGNPVRRSAPENTGGSPHQRQHGTEADPRRGIGGHPPPGAGLHLAVFPHPGGRSGDCPPSRPPGTSSTIKTRRSPYGTGRLLSWRCWRPGTTIASTGKRTCSLSWTAPPAGEDHPHRPAQYLFLG